jgi:hypothetical protein
MTMLKQSSPPPPAEALQQDQLSAVPERLATVTVQTLPRRSQGAPGRKTRTLVKRALWAVVGVGLVITLVIGLRPKPVAVECAEEIWS